MDQEIINYANAKGMILTEEALRLLNNYNYRDVIDKLKIKDKIFVLPKDVIDVCKDGDCKVKPEYTKNYYIMDKYDVTGKTYSQGRVEDFLNLFTDKYKTISEIIKERSDFEPTNISEAKHLGKNKKVDIIGMVYEKRTSKNGNTIINVDDPTGSVNLVVTSKNEELFKEAKEILNDNVIGFKCNVIAENMFIVNEIIYPDIPIQNNKPHLNEEVYVAIIADVHIGSKLFLENEFTEFIDWLSGKDDGDQRLAKKIKYLIIAGDLVDGIGVYPAQFEELAITDIFKQYELFEDYILKIPKDITIFITPGNHDAVRLSDPQPAITKQFLPRLSEQENIHLMGSPSWVNLEGFKTLIYHGASLHGIYAEIKEATMSTPDIAMREVIKRRDLMPQYGERQTFIPMEKNLMTINEVPDIFIGADVHHHAYSKYKNCHLINASCWQSITAYQIEKGHHPTLCKVLLLNLKDQTLKIKDFLKPEEEKMQL
ncbi:MAG: DNA-directed DNA polymerase II small subunit [archaeon]